MIVNQFDTMAAWSPALAASAWSASAQAPSHSRSLRLARITVGMHYRAMGCQTGPIGGFYSHWNLWLGQSLAPSCCALKLLTRAWGHDAVACAWPGCPRCSRIHCPAPYMLEQVLQELTANDHDMVTQAGDARSLARCASKKCPFVTVTHPPAQRLLGPGRGPCDPSLHV
jgi:hypothetical protein